MMICVVKSVRAVSKSNW